MYRVIFTNAPDRLIHHRAALIAFPQTVDDLLEVVTRYSHAYASVRISLNRG
jgi:hypothetical protein